MRNSGAADRACISLTRAAVARVKRNAAFCEIFFNVVEARGSNSSEFKSSRTTSKDHLGNNLLVVGRSREKFSNSSYRNISVPGFQLAPVSLYTLEIAALYPFIVIGCKLSFSNNSIKPLASSGDVSRQGCKLFSAHQLANRLHSLS